MLARDRRHNPTRLPLLTLGLVIAALFWMASPLPLAAAPPAAGLVGYWPFDGSFDDASGHGNNGENLGAVLAPDRFGRLDHAVAVSPGYLSVPDAPSLALSEAFTVALWFRQDAVESSFNCLVGKDYQTAFAVGIYSGGSGDCPAPGVSRRLVVYVGDQAASFPETSFECGNGEWKHVAVTFDASTGQMQLFVDGALAETGMNGGVLAPSSSPLGIGRDGTFNDYFTGLLDDVCLYDRVLSAAEVEALYAGEVTNPSVENPGANAYVVSASAHAAGINQTSWLTDLVLHNPGSGDATADLFFLESRTDNTQAAPYRVTVPAAASLRLADVVSTLFGRDEETGAILVGADRPLIVSSRTFNDATSGTYGQYIPGVDASTAWGATQALPRLVQLASSPDSGSGFRTNLGAVNLGGSQLTVDLELHSGGGELLGTVQLTAPPYGHVQLSDVFAGVATEKLDDAFAEVTSVTPGARYLVYASVVDNRSGDPVYLPGR